MTSGWFLFGTLVFDLLVFSHTRFVLLSLLSLPLIFRHCFVKKFGFKKAGLILVVFIFLISFLNLVRTGRFLESDQENNGNSLQKLIRQFQTAGNKSTETFFKMYEEIQSENVDFEYGKQFLITLMTPVPRKLWEDKPITSYFWRLTRQLEGQYPGPGQKVLTSTLFGEMYHQFGVVGVFVSSFIFLFIIFSLVYWLRRYENSDFIIWLQVIAIPMGIRGSLSSLLVKSIIVAAIFFVLSVFVYRPKTGNDSVAQAGADLTLFPF
jgi:oligosaccharide repeat unit polymerase